MPPADSKSSRHFGSTALCVAVVLLCVFISHPVLDSGFGDDASYIYTAKRAAETGRIIYNGWACPMLGIMVYLAALLIKLFGFSFTVVRAAVILLCLANVAVLHRLFLRLSPNNLSATVAACAVALGPTAFAYSEYFYTDVPSMFSAVVTLYCCVRAMQSQTARETCRWMIWATVANLALGSVRQIAWMGALVLVPTVGWALRRRAGVLGTAIACWVASAVVVSVALHWLAHQAYAPQEALILRYNLSWLYRSFGIPAALLLESLPLLLAFLTVKHVRRQPGLLVQSIAVATVVCLGVHLSPLHFYLEFAYEADTSGSFLQQPLFAMALLWLCLVSLSLAFFLAIQTNATRPVAYEAVAFRRLFFITLPYTCVCFVLVMTREAAWTRYILSLVPISAVLLFRLYAELTENTSLPAVTIGVAALYAVVSVVVAHDNFVLWRTDKTAERWYVAQGMPRDQLEAGLAMDGWFELSNGHTFNEPRIRIPANAYKPRKISPELAPCVSSYLPYMLDIHPVDVLSRNPMDNTCYEPVPLHQEIAHTWSRPDATTSIFRLLPPLRGQ